jgi:hypothetical protein
VGDAHDQYFTRNEKSTDDAVLLDGVRAV